MRPFGALVSLEEARAALLALARPTDRVEEIPLGDACGRVLAEPVRAAFDVPAFDRSAMDGFAVRAVDVAHAPAELAVVESVHAGEVANRGVERGEAIRIATGAPIPSGADAVVRVEDTGPASNAGHVRVTAAVVAGQHVSRRGSDVVAGSTPLARGASLSPASVGVLAALGVSRVRVFARARIAVAPTGNEVASAGRPLAPGELYDSNGPTLAAMFSSAGASVVRLPPLGDRLAALEAAFDAHVSAVDLFVFTGGSSVGERDLVVDLVAKRGEVKVHGVAVRPGKPMLIGVADDVPVVGLPGNPASCLTNAHVFVLPALRRIARLPEVPTRRVRATLAAPVGATPGRVFVCPVRLDADRATPTFKESGAVTSLAGSDGYVLVPAGEALAARSVVDVVLW